MLCVFDVSLAGEHPRLCANTERRGICIWSVVCSQYIVLSAGNWHCMVSVGSVNKAPFLRFCYWHWLNVWNLFSNVEIVFPLYGPRFPEIKLTMTTTIVMMNATLPTLTTVFFLSMLSGPSGCSIRYDRYGFIYTYIYLQYLQRSTHSRYIHIHSKVDRSLQHVYPRRQQWNVLPTVQSINRSARPTTITCPPPHPRVNFKTIYGANSWFAGSQVTFTWRPGYQTQRSVTPGYH